MRIFESPSTAEKTREDPLRIFHFLYDHTANPWVGGGAALRAREIYGRLSARHDVTLISGRYPGAKDYAEGGVKYRFVGTDRVNYVLSTFSYAFSAARYLRDNRDKADVVVEDFAPYNPIFSSRAWKDAVLQLHQREGINILRKYLLLGIPFYLIEKFYPGSFRNVTVVSEASRRKYGLGDDARVIPNGFDESYLDVEGGDGGYLLFLGRLEVDSKALDVLFDALESLEGIHLKVAGKGKDEQKVREMVNNAGSRNKVEMLGFVQGEEKVNVMKDCSAMVIPSRFEGGPLTAIEAAAFGKPVVVSDIPELSYAAEAGFGLRVRREDAKDLADKIKHLMGNESLRQEMGLKARHYARDFTWDAIAVQYESFLLKALESDG
jgi:glycosyltransferase involved in cell wall biosynthesis